MRKFLLLSLGFGVFTLLGACGNGDDSGSGGADAGAAQPSGDASPSTGADGGETTPGLTCASHTVCTSYNYTVFAETSITPAAGGTISDGFYRTAYGEDTTLTSNGTEALEAYVFSGNQYIHLGEGNSEVGTYTTSGDTITFTPTSECNSATGAADTGTPEPSSQEHFTFANGSFALYYAASSTDTELTMYAPVDAFCDLPQSPATSPSADTAFCDVTNCGCTENTNAPADAQTCQTVSGH